MELLELLEAAAKSGVLALLLALWAVGHQTREVRRARAERETDRERHEAAEKDCEDRVDKLQRAVFELHLWARSTGGGRRRSKLPDLSDLIGEPSDTARTQH